MTIIKNVTILWTFYYLYKCKIYDKHITELGRRNTYMYIYLNIKYGYFSICEVVRYHIYIDYDQLKIYIINFLQTTKISLNCGLQLMSQQSWQNGIINNML